jgi:hypothetical protein
MFTHTHFFFGKLFSLKANRKAQEKGQSNNLKGFAFLSVMAAAEPVYMTFITVIIHSSTSNSLRAHYRTSLGTRL